MSAKGDIGRIKKSCSVKCRPKKKRLKKLHESSAGPCETESEKRAMDGIPTDRSDWSVAAAKGGDYAQSETSSSITIRITFNFIFLLLLLSLAAIIQILFPADVGASQNLSLLPSFSFFLFFVVECGHKSGGRQRRSYVRPGREKSLRDGE